MTGEQIIKALENAKAVVDHNDIEVIEFFEQAIDLINRQKAEIERYQKEHKEFCIRLGYLHSLELKVMERADEIKAEAVKEFAERICEGRVANDPVVIAAKCELKEMVGEKDG